MIERRHYRGKLGKRFDLNQCVRVWVFIEGLNIESSDYLTALWSFIAANGLKAIEDARLHFFTR
jgi:hypothetical protein